MKIYTNNKFSGRWPVGSAAVVMAGDAEEAAKLLEYELKDIGLSQRVDPVDMIEFQYGVRILCDGEY